LFGLIFLLLLIFYIYDRFLLEDEVILGLPNQKVLETDYSKITAEVYIISFDEEKCEFNYCVFNDCSYNLALGCDKFEGSYQGLGNYLLTLGFNTYKFSIAGKRFLTNWDIELISTDKNTEKSKEKDSILVGLKELLEQQYVWEISSAVIPPSRASGEAWFKNTKVILSDDYLKSLSLLNEVSKKLKDEKLQKIFEREIEHLNVNREQIIAENSYMFYELTSGAYILKLVDLGLNEDYLSFLNGFISPVDEESVFSLNSNEQPLLLSQGEPYSIEYLDIVRFSEDYRIFKEYGREDLAKYSYNKMIEAYDQSELVVNGLCSLAYSDNELVNPEGLKGRLEKIFSNDERELIEGNIYELLICDLYARKNGIEIKGLKGAVSQAFRLQLREVDEIPFVVRTLSIETSEGLTGFVNKLNMADNLMYLLYEE
jgi:hypothetical protein